MFSAQLERGVIKLLTFGRSQLNSSTPWIASPTSAADATENARHSVALRSAQLTMLQLRPRRHCRRCRRRASHAPRGRRLACGCAPRGCGSATRSRSDLHEAEGERRGGCPEFDGARPAPGLCPCNSSSTRRRTPARHLRNLRYEWLHVNARARMPYLRAVRPVHQRTGSPRLPVRARNYSRARSASRSMQSLRPSSQRHGGKVSHLWPWATSAS